MDFYNKKTVRKTCRYDWNQKKPQEKGLARKILAAAAIAGLTVIGAQAGANAQDYDNLKNAVQATDNNREYNLTENEQVTENLGSMGGDGSTLTINGNGYSIIGNNNTGIISNIYRNNNLIINNITEISGFNGAFLSDKTGCNLTINAITNDTIFSDASQVNLYNNDTMYLNAASGKSITFGGSVTGDSEDSGVINVNAEDDNTGTINFNGTVTDNKIIQTAGTVNFTNSGSATLTYDGNNYPNGIADGYSANYYGGTDTYMVKVNGGNLNIDNSVFADNQAGVMHLSAETASTIKDSIFANNTTTSASAVSARLITNLGELSVEGSQFVNNQVTETNTTNTGGIIGNKGTITKIIDSDFNYNTITSSGAQWGSIISNGLGTNRIANLNLIQNVNFIGNTAHTMSAAPHGGVLLNLANIGTIDNVVFEDNTMYSDPNKFGGAHGGAIDNNVSGIIDKITNTIFKNNSITRSGENTTTSNYHATGGAIDNFNYIGEISNTTFENNYVSTTVAHGGAGAIYNTHINDTTEIGTIGSIINVTFKNNYAYSQSNYMMGGAILNGGTIGDMVASFEGNYTQTGSGVVYGGAIYNTESIGNITGADGAKTFFKNNYGISETGNVEGGNIFSLGKAATPAYIASINADFEGNYAQTDGRASGGAINNNNYSTITNGITGNFTGNFAKSTGTSALARGGAILNGGIIGNITGNFTDNYAQSSGTGAMGGAIYNMYGSSQQGALGTLSGTYSNNYVSATSIDGYAYGGAIYNGLNSTVAAITASAFTNNYASATGENGVAFGGAIYNEGSIPLISSTDFSQNYADKGGAIYNIGTITNILGGEFSQNTSTDGIGGAIYNTGTIGELDNDGEFVEGKGIIGVTFLGNYLGDDSNTGDASGSAINNEGNIYIADSNFTGNYAKSTSSAKGAAIRNAAEGVMQIENTIFSNNYAKGGISGGAIYNKGLITNISGSFENNEVNRPYAAGGSVTGGAIDNFNVITSINANFTGNHVLNQGNWGMGGAIMNYNGDNTDPDTHPIIGSIKGNFTNNYVDSTNYGQGGAIFNWEGSEIGSIEGNFDGNYVKGPSGAQGGAIYNWGDIADINSGSFDNNYAQSNSNTAGGGAIFNNNTIGNLVATNGFNGNYAQSGSGNAEGGAIMNSAGTSTSLNTINSINANFEGNYALTAGRASGGAINNNTYTQITNGITGNFTSNYAESTGTNALARGGAVLNFGYIGQGITGNFTGNYAKSSGTGAIGGAIATMTGGSSGVIDAINGNFISNYALATGANGYAQGGAIWNKGTISINPGTTYSGNYAQATATGGYAQGGAIYNCGTISDFTGIEFTDNYVESSYKHAQGGAIYNAANSYLGTITGTFTDNYAVVGDGAWDIRAQGGAIYNAANAAPVSIVDSTFTGNHTEATTTANWAQGGAIYNASTMSVIGSTFTQNQANGTGLNRDNSGGAIYNTSWLSSAKSQFISAMNTSDSPATSYSSVDDVMNAKGVTTYEELYQVIKGEAYSGDPLTESSLISALGYTDKGGLTITDSTFISNTAGRNGGALHNSGTAIISGSEFKSNTATANGGAIINGGTLIIDDATFTSNTAQTGGAIYSNGGNVTITNSTFKSNWATGYYYTGGGIHINNGNLLVSDSLFQNNGAPGDGGAIFLQNSNATIKDTNFINNHATQYTNTRGGAIAVHTGSVLDYIATKDNLISRNYAFSDGGHAIANLGTLNFTGGEYITFSENGVKEDGSTGRGDSGGGAIQNRGTITGIHDMTFIGNANTGAGGAIANVSGATIADGIKNATFTNNKGGNGGAIYNAALITDGITNSTFTGNTSTSNGGAIYNNQSGANALSVTNSTFTDNTATNQGGAIWNSGTLNLIGAENITFTGNKTTGGNNDNNGGGAIYNSGTLSGIYNITFSQNSSTNHGGAIRNQGNILDGITNSTFTNNRGRNGGAVWNSSSGDKALSVTNSTFTDNTALSHGGAIYNTGLTTIVDSTITNNTAGGDGGAIWNSGTIVMTDTVIQNNTANYGGVMRNNGNVTIVTTKDNEISGNKSNARGGALENYSVINFVGSEYITFSNNKTIGTGNHDDWGGGAIYNGGTITGFDNLTFTGNSANHHGGALYNNGTISGGINNSSFTQNSASIGGAIRNNSVLSLAVTKFINAMNTADSPETAYTSVNDVMIAKGVETYQELYEAVKGEAYTGEDLSTEELLLSALGYKTTGGIEINNSTFTGNTASSQGGAIYNTGTATVNNSTFTNNKGNGGAIYNNTSKEFNINAILTDTTFAGNKVNTTPNALHNLGTVNITSAVSGATLDKNNNNSDARVVFLDAITGTNGIINVGGTGTTEFHHNIGGNTVNINSGITSIISDNNAIALSSPIVNATNLYLNAGNYAITSTGAISGGGDVYINAADVVSTSVVINENGTTTNTRGIAPTTGTVNLNSTVAQRNMTVNGGIVTSNGAITLTNAYTQNDGTVTANNDLTAASATIANGTLNIGASNLLITNAINNSAGTINLGGGTLTSGITNSNGTASNWKGSVNLLGDLILNNTIQRNNLNIGGNTLKYGTTSASINIASKDFYSSEGAVFDATNTAVAHTINMGTVHLTDDLTFLTDVNLNVANNQQRSDRLNIETIGEDSTGNIVLDSINILTEGTKVFSKVYYTNGTAKNIAHLADNVTITKAEGVNNTYTINASGSDNNGAYYLMKNNDIHNFVTATRYDDLTATNDVYTLTGDVNIANDIAQIGDAPESNIAIGNIKSDRAVYTIDGNGYSINGASKGGITVANGQTLIIKNINGQKSTGNAKDKGWYGGSYNTYTIQNGGTLSVENSNYTNNSARSFDVVGKISSIDNVKFVGNASGGDGGVINAHNGGRVDLINNSLFQNNYTSVYGGSIKVAQGQVNIVDTDFIGNVAGDDGGAINVNSHSSNVLNITALTKDVHFTDNVSADIGGAISDVGGQFTLKAIGGDIIFSNNTGFATVSRNNTTGEITVTGGRANDIWNRITLALRATEEHKIDFGGSIEGTGTIDIGGAYTDGEETKTYTGTINFGGNVTQYNMNINSGIINLNSNLKLNIDTSNRQGTLTINDGIFNANGDLNIARTYVQNGGTVNANSTIITPTLTVNNGTLITNGEVTTTTTNIKGGSTVTNALLSATTLNVSAGTLNTVGTSDIGTINVSGGEYTADGTVDAKTKVAVSNGSVTFNNNLTAGTMNVTGGTVALNATTNVNKTVDINDETGEETVLTTGAYTQNAGTVTNSGRFSSETFALSGSGIFNANGTTTANTNLLQTGGTFNANAATNIGESLNISGGLFNANAKVTTPNLALTGGTLHAGVNNAFAVTNFNGTGGTLDFVTGAIESQTLGSVALDNTVALAIDVALNGTSATNRGDRVIATSLVDGSTGMIDLNSVTVVADSDVRYTKVYYTNGALKDNATSLITSLTGANGTTIYSVSAGSDDNGAYLIFRNNDILNLVIAAREYQGNVADADNVTYRLSGDESISSDIAIIGGSANTNSIGKLAGGDDGTATTSNEVFTIDGNGYSVNGNGKGGITVASGQTLNIQNVNGENSTGDAQGKGWYGFSTGASVILSNNGNLNVDDSNFSNNTSTYSGTVLYNNANGTVAISDTVFDGNRNSSVYGGGYGSVINNVGTITKIENSIFSNNNHFRSGNAGVGGAIYNNGTIGEITANFIGNSATSTCAANDVARGGALYNDNNHTIDSIIGNFTNNYAYVNSSRGDALAGAIYSHGAINYLSGNYTGNSAFATNGHGVAGAIYNRRGNVLIDNSNFVNNYAKSDGGAIYNFNDANAKTTIKDSSFIGNASGSIGGAIANISYGTVNVIADTKDVEFRDNKVGVEFTLNEAGRVIGVTGGTDNDIFNSGTLTLKAKTDKSINFGGTITRSGTSGTTNIGGTYNVEVPAVDEETGEETTTTETRTYDGTINFNDTVTQQNMNVYSGVFNIDADDLKITNAINNSAGTINLGEGTLTSGITNSNGTASNWKGSVNLLGDLILNNTIQRNNLNIGGNTLKYGTTSASINIASKDFYSSEGAVFDATNTAVAHTINMGTVHLTDDLTFKTDVNLNVSNQSQRSDRLNVASIGEDSTGDIVLDSINILTEGTKLYTKVYYTNGTAKDIAYVADDVTITKAEGVNNTYTITSSGSDSTGAYYLMHNDGIHNFVTATRYDDLTATNDVYTLTGDVNIANDLAQLGDDPNGVISIGNIKSDREVYTIDGAGYSINGAGKGGITVADGQTLNVKNVGSFTKDSETGEVTITNAGWTGFAGTASTTLIPTIQNNGNLSINNTLFASNSTYDTSPIYNTGRIIEISNSVFNNNTVVGGAGGRAGIIRNQGTIENISNSDFINNNQPAGGVIFNNNSATINRIANSNFIDNVGTAKALNNGGAAINNNYSSTILMILDANFKNNFIKSDNTASANGGAIINTRSSKISYIKANFENNYVMTTQTTTDALGGAINNGGQAGTIGYISGSFKNNYANGGRYGYGGAIYNVDKIGAIIDTTFEGNSAKTSGGAIYNTGTTQLIANQKDVIFRDNMIGGEFTYDETTGRITGHTGGTANDIHNTGTLNLNAGTYTDDDDQTQARNITFGGSITGTGTMNINKSGLTYRTVDEDLNDITQNITQTEGTINFNDSVTQNNINIYSGTVNANAAYNATNSTNAAAGTLNIGASNLHVTNGLTNRGTVNLADGTLTSNITDNTGTTNVVGNVVNDANITQKEVNIESENTLTNNEAKNITVSTLANSGNVANAGNITTSTLNQSGTFTNTGAVTVNTTLNNTNGIANAGNITVKGTNNLGTVTGITTGEGDETTVSTSGVLNLGTASTDVLTINSSVSNQTLNLNAGTTKLASTGALVDNVGLSANGGALDTQNAQIDSLALGNVTLNNDLILTIDANLTTETADNFSADSITANGHKILIDNIKVLADGSTKYIYAQVVDDTLKAHTGLSHENFTASKLSGAGSYTVTYEARGYGQGGWLTFNNTDVNNLVIAARTAGDDVVYAMAHDESITEDLAMIPDTTTNAIGNQVGKVFTINADGHNINGDGKGGITVSSVQTLNINNVGSFETDVQTGATTITGNGWNGFSSTVVLNAGIVNIKDSVFYGNTANNSDGGVLYSSGTASITDSMFANNSANNGGAISSYAGVSIGDNNIFQNNTARYNGGAIDISSSFSIGENNIFRNNTGGYNGGAINAVTVEIGKNAQFINNSTGNTGYGGAIYARSVTVDDGAIFKNNSAYNGGAIYASFVEIGKNAQFINNTAQSSSGQGGAIYAGHVTIDDGALFQNNTAGIGGAIYSYAVASIGDNATFKNNTASSSNYGGGAIYASFVTVDDGAIFQNNTAGTGGAIYSYSGLSIGDNATFKNNTASSSNYGGGAIYNGSNSGSVTIGDNSTFEGNTSSGNGGAIYNGSNSASVTIGDNSAFESNTAGAGSAIFSNGSVTIGDNVIFKNNITRNSTQGGGAIYSQAFVEIGDNAQFLNNKLLDNAPGSAIFSNVSVTIGDNAKFENNSGMFGAIYTRYGVTVGSGAQFVNNIGTGPGPGAAIHTSGKVTIGANSKFENNYSNLFAGAIYANSVDIGANSVFKNNYGAVNSAPGGAINIYGGNTYTSTITDTDFIDNANAGDGGAIGITGRSTVNLIAQDKNMTFSGNKSKATITRNAETGEVTVEGGVANDIYNQGTLNLKAGQGKSITFGGSITDANSPIGTITVGDTSGTYAGDINFNDSVTQKDMTITSGTANIGASDLKITNGVLNNAHLNLYDGELTTKVTGTGTTHIDANDKVIVNTTITNNTLSLDKGTAKIAHKDLLTLAGTIGNGGALDIANNEIENLNLANVTLNGEDIKLSIDTNFETRVADVISGVVISNEGGNHIVIQNINAISDTVLGATVPYGIKVAEQNIKDNVILANDFYVNSENLRNNYFITYGDSEDSTYGQLEIAFANLKTAVTNGSTQKIYTMAEDEVVTEDLGDLGGTTLSVNAGNNKITGQGETGGINVYDGQTLTINNASEYSGFDTVVTNNEGGTVNINNSTVKDNNTGVDNKDGATVNITNSTFNNTTTDVANDGTMNLNGDNTFEKKVSGSGDTNIQTGKTTVGENAQFSQGSLTINEDAELGNNNKVTVGSLTNNGDVTNTNGAELNINGDSTSNSVNNGTIDNDGTITVNSKLTNNGEISGDGTLENKSNFTNGENGSVEQTTVTNNGGTLNNNGTITAETISNSNGGVINSNASNLTGDIENNATLNLTGGTNANTITGTNGTTNFGGTTANNAEITQSTVTNSGSLDNNSTITANITNSGSLDNSDGKLIGTITNNEGASITSNASNLVGTVDNDGTLTLNGGTVQDTISGDGKTVINSSTVTLDNKEITDNDIELKDGATLAIRNDGKISDANSLIAKGGTIDLLDNATKTTDLGNIDLSNGNLNIGIDVDLAAVKGDVITGEVTEEGGSILLSEVRILTDSTTRIPLEVLVADTGVRNYVDLADNARTSSSQTTSYLLTYTKSTGELTFEYSDLENAVKSETPTKVYNVGSNGETVNNDLGELKGNSLVINGNNKNITGQGTTEGITVSEGQRLAINDVDNYSGFDTAITNTEGGTLEVSNTDFNHNQTADIDNDSTLNFYGTDSFDKVTGEGTTNIKSDTQGNGADVTVNNNGTFEQEQINIDTNSTLHNNGTVTTNNVNNEGTLDNNKTVNADVTNSGTVNNSGTINGDIDNNANSQLTTSGNINGEIENDGTITNTGLITGAITNNEDGKITSKADGIVGDIANDGEFNLNGGANNNTITGNGTTNFSGTGSNNATITQSAVNNSGNLTNNADIKAPVGNTGKLTNSSTGTLTDITNGNNGEFINKGQVTGDTVNNGKLTNNGTLNTFTNNSSAVNNANITGNTTNNSTLTNNGLLSGDLTNNKNGKISNNGQINSENILNKGKITTATQNLISPNTVQNNGTITYNSGSQTYVDIAGNGKINLDTNSGLLINNRIEGNQINLNNSIISFGDNGDISNARSLNVNGGGINIKDNKITSTNLGNVNLNKNSKLMLDFNVSNETSDKLIANVKNNGGKFVVTSINIKGTTLKDKIRVHLGDSTTLGRKNTTSTTFKLPDIVTPIRRLHGNVSGGWLNYTSAGGNGYKDFSPSVMASSVATQVGGIISQNQTLQQGFYHMDRYSKYPYTQRFAAENANTYAMNESVPVYTAKSELPLTSEAMWTNPYTTFEKVDLKGGVGVSNVAYGTLYGGDSNLKDLGHGKKGVVSAFVGYNGNHMSYDGISMNQQGGLLGLTGTLYKGNFFTGLTMSTGASAGEAYTQFGTDKFAMLTAGVANRTGYNWELKDGKIIVQPSMYLGYTFAKTFDYKNSAGARIESDPAHSIQIAPSLKIIGNTKNGWHPYIGADMVWNIQTGGKVTAEDTRLPQVSTKPYIQYGVGVQKSWGDRFTAYGQTMLRNGGRTGVVLNVGFRWTLGKNTSKNNTKVTAPTNKTTQQPKQIIKQIRPVTGDMTTTRTSINAKIENI